jgi:hypothetical protein
MAGPVAPESPPIATFALEYSRTSPASCSRFIRAILLSATLPAAITPFLQFTWSTSPLDVIRDITYATVHQSPDLGMPFGLIAGPFFIGTILFLWQLRLLVWPRTSKAERVIMLSLAGTSALLTVGFFAMGIHDALNGGRAPSSDFWIVGSGQFILLLAGVLLLWLRKRGGSGNSLASLALHAAYLANAGICLLGFFHDYDAGAWLTLIAVPLLLFNVIQISLRPRL